MLSPAVKKVSNRMFFRPLLLDECELKNLLHSPPTFAEADDTSEGQEAERQLPGKHFRHRGGYPKKFHEHPSEVPRRRTRHHEVFSEVISAEESHPGSPEPSDQVASATTIATATIPASAAAAGSASASAATATVSSAALSYSAVATTAIAATANFLKSR